MTAQQIVKRVEQEADARLPEVVERLLILLDMRTDAARFYKKWVQTGLLEKVSEEDQNEAAFALETTALMLIDETTKKGDTSWETNEDYIVARFKEAIAPYESAPIGKLLYGSGCHT